MFMQCNAMQRGWRLGTGQFDVIPACNHVTQLLVMKADTVFDGISKEYPACLSFTDVAFSEDCYQCIQRARDFPAERIARR